MCEGVGLGFRRQLTDALLENTAPLPAFVEFAPENWLGVGGFLGKQLRRIVERYPTMAHGLSLSLGSPEPLDRDFLRQVKNFLQEFNIQIYSEHLSYSKCDNAHLYDLLPMPFTEEAVRHISRRIVEVQDFLGRKIAVENVSYYMCASAQMDEATFVRSVLEDADCNLLLDVNNVFVNAHNHKYDPYRFLEALPLERVVYIHVAGHEDVEEDLKIDTHGEPVCNGVYELLEWVCQKVGPVPILLERDSNIPDIADLFAEMERLQEIADRAWKASHVC